MSSSESDHDENPSDQQSENEENGDKIETTIGQDSDKPVTWSDLVSEAVIS